VRKALIACGGTGGHLSPGIALAEELVSAGWDCRLLVSSKQVDSRLARKYTQFSYESIPGSGLSLRPSRLLRFAYDLAVGTGACLAKVREYRPSVVIGFGGFLSMPALLAGFLRGAPVAIHEANREPGRVTRLAALFANRVYLPEGVPLKTPYASRIRYAGMPTRREIRPLAKSKARRDLGFNPEQRLLFVFGGSQGALALTDWVKRHIETFAREEIQVFCLTGLGAEGRSELRFPSREGKPVRSIFSPFCDSMAGPLSAADLAVSRAGAGSIAEFIRCRLPSILVPYPTAADDHQLSNARRLERMGGGIVVEQTAIDRLFEETRETILNDWLLERFRANLQKVDRRDTLARMRRDLEGLVDAHELSLGFKSARKLAKEGQRP